MSVTQPPHDAEARVLAASLSSRGVGRDIGCCRLLPFWGRGWPLNWTIGVSPAWGAEMEDTRRFDPRTPVGLVRNFRFVEANPPAEYSLRADTPH